MRAWRALVTIPVVLELAVSVGAAGAQPAGRVSGAMAPTLVEFGKNREGGVAYIAHGYAAANAGVASLGGAAAGNFDLRVGGYCLAGSEVSVVPTGISVSTSAWAYNLTGVKVDLVKDARADVCNYTVRVTYALSITGAVTISQLEYTIYLWGSAASGAADPGKLTIIP